jgi:sulfide:quinone oxidoreductase
MNSQRQQQGSKARVLIAGGGVAAVEAMVALRDLAGDRVEVELHAPRQDFVYRPLAVGEPFLAGELIKFDLENLASRAGATFCLDSVIGVDPANRHISTPDLDEVPYDYLLICPGAKMLAAVSGAETFWGVSDEGGVAETIGRLRAGELHRLAFTIPAASWPLPIYELALLAEAELSRLGSRDAATLTIVTPEDAPLGVFGAQVGERVGQLLSDRGIELVTGSHAIKFNDGFLHITPGQPIEAEAVISTPGIEGRQIGGLPTDPSGFIPVDEFSRVVGLDRVYAAGDVTAFPVKQGGIATQQADVAAEAIAAAVGVDLAPRPFDPVLRATLWTGEKPQYLYGKLSGGFGETSVFSDHALWEHEGKIAGRYLAPFLNATPGKAGPGSHTGPQPQVAAC